MKTIPVAETYDHVYKGEVQSVTVTVHINYHEEYISLVDKNPSNPTGLTGKSWKFNKREIEYMKGWHDILDAMKDAVSHATSKLEAYQKDVEEEKLRIAEEMAKQSN